MSNFDELVEDVKAGAPKLRGLMRAAGIEMGAQIHDCEFRVRVCFMRDGDIIRGVFNRADGAPDMDHLVKLISYNFEENANDRQRAIDKTPE